MAAGLFFGSGGGDFGGDGWLGLSVAAGRTCLDGCASPDCDSLARLAAVRAIGCFVGRCFVGPCLMGPCSLDSADAGAAGLFFGGTCRGVCLLPGEPAGAGLPAGWGPGMIMLRSQTGQRTLRPMLLVGTDRT